MSIRTILAAALLLALAFPGLAEAEERVVLYERAFSEAFVANEQAYLVVRVPEGYADVRLEVDCNLHAGAVTLVDAAAQAVAVACDGLTERPLEAQMASGYWYGVASFTGLNGVAVRVTGVPSAAS